MIGQGVPQQARLGSGDSAQSANALEDDVVVGHRRCPHVHDEIPGPDCGVQMFDLRKASERTDDVLTMPGFRRHHGDPTQSIPVDLVGEADRERFDDAVLDQSLDPCCHGRPIHLQFPREDGSGGPTVRSQKRQQPTIQIIDHAQSVSTYRTSLKK